MVRTKYLLMLMSVFCTSAILGVAFLTREYRSVHVSRVLTNVQFAQTQVSTQTDTGVDDTRDRARAELISALRQTGATHPQDNLETSGTSTEVGTVLDTRASSTQFVD